MYTIDNKNGPIISHTSYNFSVTPEEKRGKIRTYTTKPANAASIWNEITNKNNKDGRKIKAADVRKWTSELFEKAVEEWNDDVSVVNFSKFEKEMRKLCDKYGYFFSYDYDGEAANGYVIEKASGRVYYLSEIKD